MSASTSLPITLEFKAENLPNRDLIGKSDPLLVVYKLAAKQAGFGFKPEKGNFVMQEVFRTERVKNDLSPRWAKTFTYEYRFEEEQWLFLQVLDIDDKHSLDTRAQDFLGGHITTVGRIINGQEDGWFKTAMQDEKQRQVSVDGLASALYIKSTVMPEVFSKYQIRCNFTLDKSAMRMFKSETPYFQVINQNRQVVYESRKGHGKESEYPSFTLPGMHAAQTTWKFAHNHDGDDIGSVSITEQQLQALPPGASLQVLDGFGSCKGYLTFVNIFVEQHVEESIVHKLDGGLNISAVVAYDFTGSNGDPKQPHSLHYLGGGRNQYRDATSSIIPIIDQYDSDGLYDVYGFGMSYDGKTTDHTKLFTSDAKYADGVLMTYESVVRANNFHLAGPTYFSPVINAVATKVESAANRNTYTVLVIFTDGAINDMDATVEAVVSASYKPMSIIIVGIGQADFGAMNRLDNDGKPPLKDRNGRSAARDIVQFVPLRDCPDGATLQRITLAELPAQIHEFYRRG